LAQMKDAQLCNFKKIGTWKNYAGVSVGYCSGGKEK